MGLFNAFLIVVLRIPDMLATLASLFVIQGVAMTYSYGGSITENMVSAERRDGGGYYPGGLWRAGAGADHRHYHAGGDADRPAGAVVHYPRTADVRHRRQPEAARLSGLRITRYKVAAYVIASLLAGLGGILLASRIGSSQVNAGGGYLMDAVAAAWIGFSLAGSGKPNALGTLVGR